jgi:hypothetical protein
VSPVNFVPAPDQGDAQAVVLGVEMHPEVVTILLVSTIFEELAAEAFFDPEDPKLKVEDDLGAEYRRALQIGMGSKWSESNGVRRSNLDFEPPVSAEATPPVDHSRPPGQRHLGDLSDAHRPLHSRPGAR